MEVGFLQLGTGDVSFVAASTVIKFPQCWLKIKDRTTILFMQIAASNGTTTNNYNSWRYKSLIMLGSKSTFLARIM
jgi:hypothetical protein